MFGGHSDLDHLRYSVEICNIVALQFWLVAERAQIKSSVRNNSIMLLGPRKVSRSQK